MWTCQKCGEEVEGSFELCWNCRTTRDGRVGSVHGKDSISDAEATQPHDPNAAEQEDVRSSSATVTVEGNRPGRNLYSVWSIIVASFFVSPNETHLYPRHMLLENRRDLERPELGTLVAEVHRVARVAPRGNHYQVFPHGVLPVAGARDDLDLMVQDVDHAIIEGPVGRGGIEGKPLADEQNVQIHGVGDRGGGYSLGLNLMCRL